MLMMKKMMVLDLASVSYHPGLRRPYQLIMRGEKEEEEELMIQCLVGGLRYIYYYYCIFYWCVLYRESVMNSLYSWKIKMIHLKEV